MGIIYKKYLLTLAIDFFLVFFIITRQLYSKLPEIASYTILVLFIFSTILYNKESLFFYTKFDKRSYYVFFCFICGAILALVISNDPYPLISALYATTFYKSNKKIKIKNLLIFTTSIFCIVVILSLLNVIPSNHEPIFDGFYFKPEKLSFGFITANYTFLIFNLIILLYFLYKKRFSFVACFLFILFSSVLFAFTRSRTGYIISLLIILSGNFLYDHFKSNIKHKYIILIGFILISFALSLNFLGIGEKSNVILNGRPLMWNYYLNQGLTLLGMNYKMYIFVDNYYLYILIFDGLICFAFTMMPLLFMYRKIKNKKVIVCLIFIFFYFIFENCFKIFVPFISYLIYEAIFSLSYVTKEKPQKTN